VTPCGPVHWYLDFWGTYCFHPQGCRLVGCTNLTHYIRPISTSLPPTEAQSSHSAATSICNLFLRLSWMWNHTKQESNDSHQFTYPSVWGVWVWSHGRCDEEKNNCHYRKLNTSHKVRSHFFPECGLDGCLLTLAYYAFPRWYEFGERRRNDIDGGKPKNSEKNLFQCHFVHHKSYMDWHGSEPGPPRCEDGV
jgi:hypothetical protein